MTDENYDPDRLVVETAHGRVRGGFRRGAYRYRGIPYADAPIGDRRFAPPASVSDWHETLDATEFSPVAPQPADMMSQLLGRGDGPPRSEAECLTLNVWTPCPDDDERPVLVWVHGGAFVSGSGREPWYDGANLTRRDVVVVTINYRLGALGFLHLADLGGARFVGSGNLGLLDQVAALRWVRENIAAFGGDPSNVTIFGESAGGMSVASQLVLSASDGLFNRVIAQSGAIANISDPDRASHIATDVLGELGLTVDRVEEIISVPAAAIVAAQQVVAANHGLMGGLPFQPVADGVVMPSDPMGALAGGAAKGIDLLSGTNRDEMKVFTLMNPAMRAQDDDHVTARLRGLVGDRAAEIVDAYRATNPEASPTELFEAIGTDAVFRMPALEMLDAQRAHGRCWGYEYHRPSTGMDGRLGATHAVEVPFVFDNLDAPGASFFTGEPDEAARALASQIADAWCNFARNGDPNGPALVEWPNWQPPDYATMILADHSTVEANPAAEQRAVWSIGV